MSVFDPELEIGISSGSVRDTYVKAQKVRWSTLTQALSNPNIGKKDGQYFTCTTFTNNERCSKNAEGKTASIFVLDGDSSTDKEIIGAPDPALVHKVLKKRDITHCIYTSYSNGAKGHRYRVVIPAEWTGKGELKALVESAIDLLHDEGVMLSDVPENKNIACAWYSPRVRDEAAKDDFMFFQHDGKLFADVINVTKQAPKGSFSEYADELRKIEGQYCQNIDKEVSEERVTQALESIPADCAYHDWIKILMALHSTGEDWAYDAAVEWSSRGGNKFKGKADVEKHWDSFGKAPLDGITIASLFLAASRAIDTAITPLPINNVDPLAWTKTLTVSDEEMDKISDPDWIIKDLVIQGHVITVVAEPNGGKTTLFLHLAGEMVDAGYKVNYVNADTGGGDAKAMHALAKEKGFQLLLPDMSGSSMDYVVNNLAGMNEVKADYSDIVIIIDTLKMMMTNIINKANVRKIYKLLRGLAAKGMTIILLGHTNKHKADGMSVFEGTGDVKSDTDELIYLDPEKKADGTMIITTRPDKVRGIFEPVTYIVDADRNVTLQSTVINTTAHKAALTAVAADKSTIDAIDSAITDGAITQSEIIEKLKGNEIGKRKVTDVLKKYSGAQYQTRRPEDYQLWKMTPGPRYNIKTYSILTEG